MTDFSSAVLALSSPKNSFLNRALVPRYFFLNCTGGLGKLVRFIRTSGGGVRGPNVRPWDMISSLYFGVRVEEDSGFSLCRRGDCGEGDCCDGEDMAGSA